VFPTLKRHFQHITKALTHMYQDNQTSFLERIKAAHLSSNIIFL
jgi:hypothetical protein